MRIPIAVAALLLALVASGCFVAVQGPVEGCECPPPTEDDPP